MVTKLNTIKVNYFGKFSTLKQNKYILNIMKNFLKSTLIHESNLGSLHTHLNTHVMLTIRKIYKIADDPK